MQRTSLVITKALSVASLCCFALISSVPANANVADDYVALVAGSAEEKGAAWSRIRQSFETDQVPMLLDVLHVSTSRQLRSMAVALMQDTTGKVLGAELDSWYEWLWDQDDRVDHPKLAEFKSKLWRYIDPKFAEYFSTDRPSTIRLDEVRWGGVKQDGIPPLRNPKMISAKQAKYLGDSNVIFGIEVNGQARAYPKRIAAWHEMVVETIGGVPIAAVYCTLCGTMVLFETNVDGVQHDVGTSGFLYRSNKLMFDQATQSLWNTLWGVPVIGPLVGKVELPRGSVVTSTWGEWRKRHPDTMVLSLDTGADRDYSEGTAYKDYFATDKLMFTVPDDDNRLPNKAEVFTLVDPGNRSESLAISAKFLKRHPVHHEELGNLDLVILTDSSGANRAYQSQGNRFSKWDRNKSVTGTDGAQWTLSETGLTSADGSQTLPRFPAQRAFWFGWRAAYPDTKLVK